MMEISLFGEHRTKLGESPLWDADAQCLWWVDAVSKQIHCAAADGSPLRSFQFDRHVGSIGLAEGGLIAALSDTFVLVDGKTGTFKAIAKLPDHDGTTRLNDGKMSRGNHYICGETRMKPGATGSLWCLGPQGDFGRIESGLHISNSICFSPSGDTLFFSDSLDNAIRRHAFDSSTGIVGERLGIIDCTKFGQSPDGATVDSDGNLWIAMVLDQAIACVSPEGELIRRIELPFPLPACPAFGGREMDILYVTSIADSGLSLATDHPDGGRIVEIRGLGVKGIPERRFRVSEPLSCS